MEFSDHSSTGSSNRSRASFGTGHRGSMSAPRAPYRDDPSRGSAPVWASNQQTETFADEDHFSYSPVTLPKGSSAGGGAGGNAANTIVGSFRPALEDMVDVNVSAHGKAFHIEGDGVFRNTRNNSAKPVRRSSILGMGFDDLGLETVGMKRRTLYAGAVCGLLVGLAVLLAVLISSLSNGSSSSLEAGGSSETTTHSHHDNPWLDETLTKDDCDFTGILQPDVFLQCRCQGRLSIFSEASLKNYNALRNDFVKKHILPDFSHKIDACDPANAALAWLATDVYPHEHEMYDRYLLALVYASFRGFAWTTQDNWLLTSTSHCEWHGVQCSSHNRTTELLLNDNNLEGEIPTEIVKLDSLTTLALTDNNLDGRLPRELGEWRSLEVLRLSGNHLFFSIPTEIGLLENLKDLELDHNDLQGHIPTELMRLPLLDYVGLWNNRLTGTIPTEIGNLKKCREFKINANSFTGTLPTQIGNMELLRIWESAHNSCEGDFPSQVGQLSNLVAFDISSMGLVGTLPTQLANLKAMETFAIADNYFGGSFPLALTEMTSLEYLFVNNNGFDGTLPSQMSQLRELKQLFVQNNNLGGNIPSELSMCNSLTTLDLTGNDLVGDMPAAVCDLREKKLASLVADCAGKNNNAVQCSVPDCCTGCGPAE